MRTPVGPNVMFTPPLWMDFSLLSMMMPGSVMSTDLVSPPEAVGVLVMWISGAEADGAAEAAGAGGAGGVGTAIGAGGTRRAGCGCGCEALWRPESTTVSV